MPKVTNAEPTKRERSPKWIEERIAFLKDRKKMMKVDFEIRSKNIEQELKERTAELKKLSK